MKGEGLPGKAPGKNKLTKGLTNGVGCGKVDWNGGKIWH